MQWIAVKERVKQEMESLTEKYQKDKLEFIKNSMFVEFLGLTSDTSLTESKLESNIIARYSVLKSDGPQRPPKEISIATTFSRCCAQRRP